VGRQHRGLGRTPQAVLAGSEISRLVASWFLGDNPGTSMQGVRPPDERKLVTVLFADLAGSTELVARHDPERIRALLAAFFEEMAEQVRVLGGTVEKYAGDAIMAVFGVPRVHEDDAERAVRAALGMNESLAQLNPMFEQEHGASLELRVGIASGEAVAAAGEAREFMVTGEVANLAARLQSASPGIVISEQTHRLVGRLLEAEPLPPLALKGFADTVTAYRVKGLGRAEAGGRGIPGLSSPVVGRDAETESLCRAVDELANGRGQLVSIVGEAGLGKSRLKIERRESLPPSVRWLEGRCHAYTQSTSYAPLIQVLRAIFQLNGTEPPALARTKVRAAIRSLAGTRVDQAQAAVAHLLAIDLEPGKPDARRPTLVNSSPRSWWHCAPCWRASPVVDPRSSHWRISTGRIPPRSTR